MDLKADASMRWDGLVAVERPRTRRWISVLAVVVPVFAVAAVAGWFVRAYVAPPTVRIPGPMQLASAPAERPDLSRTAAETQRTRAVETVAAAPRSEAPAVAEAADPAVTAPTRPFAPLPATPLFASLSLAPPMASLGRAPAAYADPGPAGTAGTMHEARAERPQAAPAPPRRRTSAVPLPRPRPQP